MVFTHGLFMRAVAWSLLAGVTAPDEGQMRSFRRFADRFLIPNAGIMELRRAGNGDIALLGGPTTHLPAALARRPRWGLGHARTSRNEAHDGTRLRSSAPGRTVPGAAFGGRGQEHNAGSLDAAAPVTAQ